MTRWPIPVNGFWPELHAVGERIFLAHGNAQVFLAELRWIDGGLVLVRHQPIQTDRGWNAQWIRPGILTFWKETADPDIWQRFELDALAEGWPVTPTGDDPRIVAGNPRAGNQAGMVAAAGHWATWLASRTSPFRLAYDGQTLGTRKGFPVVAGDWLAASDSYPEPNNAIQTWKAGVPATVHPCLTPLNGLAVGPDGHLVYGFVDLAFIDPSGINQRGSCTPWRTEGVGPIIRHPDGTTWIVTITWDDPTRHTAVLLRPWPDGAMPGKACLVVEAAAVHASVLPFGDQWLVATNDEQGNGLLQAVPQATPLQVLKPRVADLGTMYLGYYYAAGRYGDFKPAQNCTVLAIDNFTADAVLPANAPARMRAAADQAGAIFIGTSFEDLDAMAGRWDLVHGLMLGEHQDTAGIETEARDARARLAARGLPAKPIVATIMPDQVFQAGWRIPAGVDVLGVEIYFDGPAASFGDMRKAALRRVDQVLEHTGDLPVILIAQAYDRNRDAWRAPVGRESLEGIQSALFDAARFHKLAGIWWFAYARNGGVLGLPDVEAWHRAGVAAASRPAGLATAVPPEPVTLAATILSYQPTTGEAPLTVTAVAKVTQGTAATFTWRWRKVGAGGWQVAALNPATDPDHHYVFGEPGDYEIGLVADGPGGPAATGKQRLVTVQPRKEKPMPEPTQRPTITLKTNDGVHYVTAEDGGGREGERIGTGHGHTRAKGVLLARSTDADLGDWQRFEVHPGREAGTVGFKLAVAVATPPNDTLPSGPWVTAEPDGTLVCNRWKPADFVPEAWEAFAVQDLGDGVVALKTAHGFLWCAELGGGREVTATDRGQPGPDDDLGIWQQFTPSEPLTRGGARPGGGGILGKRAGIVRAVGSCLADDDGPFLAVGTSLFPLAYLERNEPDRLDANLAKVAGRVHYVRAFGVVSGGSWEDRVIDPRLGDWEDYLAKATDRCYDDHGIRVHWTIFAGIDLCRDPKDRERIVRRFAAAMAPRAEKVFSVELANEGWQNGFGDSGGPDELRHLCASCGTCCPTWWRSPTRPPAATPPKRCRPSGITRGRARRSPPSTRIAARTGPAGSGGRCGSRGKFTSCRTSRRCGSWTNLSGPGPAWRWTAIPCGWRCWRRPATRRGARLSPCTPARGCGWAAEPTRAAGSSTCRAKPTCSTCRGSTRSWMPWWRWPPGCRTTARTGNGRMAMKSSRRIPST
jgi:hypothetical protein